jgi:glycosyltransferase involved in cell wall biosynthesis
MTPKTLWHALRRVRWRPALATVLANIRLYGWIATAKKIAFRMGRHLDRTYRIPTGGRGGDGSEIVSSAADLFGRPAITIVGALDLPQCKKYRVSQKVEFFRSLGWNCYYSHYNDGHRTVSYLQFSTAAIFYRVPDCVEFNHYIEEARRLGMRTYYDIDDPIFNLAVYSENKNLEHIASHERAHLLGSAGAYRTAMKKVDAVILSTTYLKQLAREDFGRETYVWRNLADAALLSIVQNVRREQPARNSAKVVIGYASGSRAHDEDFRIAADALVRILELYEHAELQIIGYAVLPPVFDRFKDRIRERPFSGYAKYLAALALIDINIVPLVSDRFNACKSAIRYLEASLCTVPTVASSVGQFVEVITDGQDGYLVNTQDDWILALSRLIDSCELRSEMGAAAYENVMQNHTFSSPDVIEPQLLKQFAISNE